MRRQLHNIDNFLCRGLKTRLARHLDVLGQVVLNSHFVRSVVQADCRSMQIKIGVDSHGVFQVLRQTEAFGEVHKGTGDDVVQFPVPIPVVAVLKVLGIVVSFCVMNVLHNSIEEMADDRSACE